MQIDLQIFLLKLKEMGFIINNYQKEQLVIFKKLIQENNLKQNLTRLSSDHEIWGRFFLDGIIVYSPKDLLRAQSFLDVGTGAGIPGILIQILFPHLSVSLIEAEYQKCIFLSIVKKALNLENLTIYNQRAEIIDPDYYEKFDIVTFRALGSLNIFLEVVTPYLKVKGLLIVPKGELALDELAKAANSLKVLHLKPLKIETQKSITNYTLNTIILQKQKNTNKMFPRSWNKILKKPLN